MILQPIAAPAIDLDRFVDLEQAAAVAEGRLRLRLTDAALVRCRAAHDRLTRIVAENRHVYGITTGFGPLANRLIRPQDGQLLQQNLVNHLASGVGPALSWAEARAVVLARLMSILQGASGASQDAIAALVAVLNSDLAPMIPSRGTVGASGDLTPLAHMVLSLQGQGAFIHRDATVIAGAAGLATLGLVPLTLARRDGLALVNGTSAMTGLAVLSAADAARAIAWATALTAGLAETLAGRTEAWHAAFGELRPHPGQVATAADLRARVAGSSRCVTALTADRVLTAADVGTEDEAGQDAYTLRCAPQVIGAVRDMLAWHDQITLRELNAVTDNPVFPAAGDAAALHGGNFMGQHIALASDALSNGVLVLAGLAERQIARLTDEKLNRGLPAFLHRGPAGLNSGFMGAQVTASALLAELRAGAGAASIQSISTNAANQDVVSMGTIAARLLRQRLDLLAQIHAILALCIAQAIDIIVADMTAPGASPARSGGSPNTGDAGAFQVRDPGAAAAPDAGPAIPEDREMASGDAASAMVTAAGFSAAARAVHAGVRRFSAPLLCDRPLGAEIERLGTAIRNGPVPQA